MSRKSSKSKAFEDIVLTFLDRNRFRDYENDLGNGYGSVTVTKCGGCEEQQRYNKEMVHDSGCWVKLLDLYLKEHK